MQKTVIDRGRRSRGIRRYLEEFDPNVRLHVDDGMTVRNAARAETITPVDADPRNAIPDERTAVLSILPPCIQKWELSLSKDQNGQAWAVVPQGGRLGPVQLGSGQFHDLIVRRLAAGSITPTPGVIKLCLSVLTALAGEGECEVANRSSLGAGADTVWIDLADKERRAIRVGPEGFRIAGDSPMMFESFSHQLPLPEPDAGGDPSELFRYLPAMEEDDRLLLLAFAATAWMPMPRPILILVGAQGSAKSTFACFIRRLVDPSRIELLGGDDRADLPLIFHRHALPVFDNVDKLSSKQADMFCQATTGRGFDRRKLYTDKESVILSVKRPIIFTCLHLPTTRADFLDRSLILDLERVLPDTRRDLRTLEAEFDAARPRLFGAMLGLLSKALGTLPGVSDQGLSRMADFHRMGRAVAIAAGSTAADFDRAWATAEARQKRGTLGDSLAQTLWLFAKQAGPWEGTAEELVRDLYDTAKHNRIRISESDGLTAVGLGRRMKTLMETLARFGVKVTQRRRSKARVIGIEYDSATDSETADA